MKEQLNDIVRTLISATKNGSLVWTEDNPNLKTRTYKRKMETKGSDDTVFEMNIEYTLSDDKWRLEENSLWITNATLPNGRYNIGVYKNKDVIVLRDLIIENFCSDLDPKIEVVEDILTDICKGISISTLRNNKLSDLGI
jgi:hypothetical protein